MLDGRNLKVVFNNPGAFATRTLLLENGDESTGSRYTDAIRTAQYVYVEWSFPTAPTQYELYDLAADPYQLTSLHGIPAYVQIEADLAAKLAALKSCAGESCDSVRYP